MGSQLTESVRKMREFRFENEGTNTYLIYDLSGEAIDTMSLGMITNNKIAGFSSALYTQQDDWKYLKYNISSKVTLKQFFVGAVTKKRLLGVFTSIITALMAAEEYMIDLNSILLDEDYIFVDVSTNKAEVICVPILELGRPLGDMVAFFKNIMFSTRFDSSEDCEYVARIINYLNSAPELSLPAFNSLLQELDNMTMILSGKEQAVKMEKAAPVKQETRPQETAPVQQEIRMQETAFVQQKITPQPALQPSVTVPKAPLTPSMQIPKASQFAVPDKGKAELEGQPQKESISLFYLLQHYNKENAAAYRAQKEARKEAKAQTGNKEPKQKKARGTEIPPAPKGYQQSQRAPQVSAEISYGAAHGISGSMMPGNSIQMQAAVQPAVSPMTQPERRMGENFGETTVLNAAGAGETTVLGASVSYNPPQAYLIRVKKGERIYLNKPVFRVGKEKSFVDYFISDNTAVSRSHANFISRDGRYFVVDTNSTNHTFVNGLMISSNTETEIKHGDKVRLANEEFEFRTV